jgi:hypothetical protein
VKYIPSQIRMEGFTPFAAVNRAAPAILIFSASPKLDVIVSEHRFQLHRAFDRFEIQPVDHGRTSPELKAASAYISCCKGDPDSRPSTNWRAISGSHPKSVVGVEALRCQRDGG